MEDNFNFSVFLSLILSIFLQIQLKKFYCIKGLCFLQIIFS